MTFEQIPNSELGVINVLDYGADNTGVKDPTPAILAAVQAAWNKSYPPSVYVPAGNYKIGTSIDFSTLVLTSDLNSGWGFICDPGASFNDNLSSGSYLLNLQLPGNHIALGCKIVLGHLLSSGGGSRTGLDLIGWNDSIIEIASIQGFSQNGLQVSPSATIGTFNNLLRIGRIVGNLANGFVVLGTTGVNGFQGNTVYIGHMQNNGASGIQIDAAVGNNSYFNHFIIGVSEHNISAGIYDVNGSNKWEVANTNNNPNGGFILASGAAGIPVVRGYFQDGVNINNQKADVINYNTAPGNIAAPAIPASGTAQTNTNDRPAMINVYGGTVTAIDIDGVSTGLTSGTFRLMPGETVKLTYSVAPSWTWYLTN